MKVKLRFKPNERDNKIIEYLLTLNINNMKERALMGLEEWYCADYKNVDAWKMKCGIEHLLVSGKSKQLCNDYRIWLHSADIFDVPAMIFNNKQIPVYYNFDDVKYFLKKI